MIARTRSKRSRRGRISHADTNGHGLINNSVDQHLYDTVYCVLLRHHLTVLLPIPSSTSTLEVEMATGTMRSSALDHLSSNTAAIPISNNTRPFPLFSPNAVRTRDRHSTTGSFYNFNLRNIVFSLLTAAQDDTVNMPDLSSLVPVLLTICHRGFLEKSWERLFAGRMQN